MGAVCRIMKKAAGNSGREVWISMNMIECEKNCLYQKEGYCRLETLTALSDEPQAQGDCRYFRSAGEQRKD